MRRTRPAQPPRFVQYEPSPAELRWLEAMRRHRPEGCDAWGAGGALQQLMKSEQPSLEAQAPSWLVFEDTQGARQRSRVPIEPLVSSLRHPHLLLPGNSTRTALMDLSYLLSPSAKDMQRLLEPQARCWLFDLGAGLFNGSAPGTDGGGSLHWLTERYARRGLRFDRVLAWEATAHNPTRVWRGARAMPAWLVPALSYYNTPISANPDDAHHPWRVMVAAGVQPSDWVVVKVDIDQTELELALVRQLLHEPAVADLVDELFWEHHVAGSAVACPEMWGGRYGSGWSALVFNSSDAEKTLYGSYELFSSLRRRGILAHSWI